MSGNSVTISSNGNAVAIGADYNDGGGTHSGHVRVFNLNATKTKWKQIGSDIDGAASLDYSGTSVSMNSDGTIIAVGSRGGDGTANNSQLRDSGVVNVYIRNSNNKWVRRGKKISGMSTGDLSGWSVSLSLNGNILAIGDIASNDNTGSVRIFKWNKDAAEYQPYGKNIRGESVEDMSGWSVSLNDNGSVVAIGAIKNKIKKL